MRTLTPDRIFRIVLGALGVLLAGFLSYQFGKILGFAVISLVLSYILNPLVNRLQSNGMNRTLAITIVLFSVLGFLFLLSRTIIPTAASQIYSLTKQINESNIRALSMLIEREVTARFTFVPEGFIQENLNSFIDQLLETGALTDALGNIFNIFANVFYAALVIPVATFFFLKDGSKMQHSILELVPNAYFETTLSLLDKIEKGLGRYLKSVFLQSSIVATISMVLLGLAGLKNAVFIGIAIGLANTIPYFGPILGYLLSAIISIVEAGNLSLLGPAILAVLITQIIDNAILQPLIFSRSAKMHPVIILFVILIASEIGGIVGMLIAVPLATIIKITVEQITWSLQNYYVFRSPTAQTRS